MTTNPFEWFEPEIGRAPGYTLDHLKLAVILGQIGSTRLSDLLAWKCGAGARISTISASQATELLPMARMLRDLNR